MKHIIYCTTNLINNKIYIGIHKTENPEVFDGYIGNGIQNKNSKFIINPETPFHYAVRKYGYENFKRETIKVFDTREEALQLEKEIVNEEFIKLENTYNITIGGGAPPILCKTIYQYDLEGNFIKEWNSRTEVMNYFQSITSLNKAIKFKLARYNFYWSDIKVEKLNIQEYKHYNPKVAIYLYDNNGLLFKSFESYTECYKYLNCTLAQVQRAVKLGERLYEYHASDKLMAIYKSNIKKLEGDLHQYSLNGEYIKSYSTIKEAENYLNIKLTDITRSIKLGYSCKGYLWLRGEKLDKLKAYKPKSTKRKVGQFDMQNNLIKIFESVREARKEFSSVSKVLNGQSECCHNFKFKYIEE